MTDGTDDITRRRMQRERAARERRAVEDFKALDPSDLDGWIQAGAEAWLDYQHAIDHVTDATMKAGRAVAGIGLDHLDTLGLDQERFKDQAYGSNVAKYARAGAEILIQDRVDEMTDPSVSLLVIPLDGETLDAEHQGMIDAFAKALSEKVPYPQALYALQVALRQATRPAIAFEAKDEYVRDFDVYEPDDEPTDPDGPEAS